MPKPAHRSNRNQTLFAQLLISFILVALFTSVAVLFPELWLIRAQIEEQTWGRVYQGKRSAAALYRNYQDEVSDAAAFAAQLSRIQNLVAQRDLPALREYAATVADGLDLDLLAVCDPQQVLVHVGGEEVDVCRLGTTEGTVTVLDGPVLQAWMLSSRRFFGQTEQPLSLVTGVALDQAFVLRMQAETGLEHTLLVDGRVVATTLPSGLSGETDPLMRLFVPDPPSLGDRTFRQQTTPYFASRLSVVPGVDDEVALDVSTVLLTERRVLRTQVISLLLVLAAGSVVAVLLAHRIRRPLAQLAEAAGRISLGDLEEPIPGNATVAEVRQVADVLEHARRQLRTSLSDLQREKAWTENLLDSIVEGILTLDEAGRITFWSQGAEEITGWAREEVLGRSCDEVLRPVLASDPFTALIPRPRQRRKVAVLLADDGQATLSISRAELVPLEAGDAQIALVFRDVSDEEIMQRLLGNFMANVTHEFRTPLSALSASIELLIEQADDLSQAELEELLVSLHLGVLGLQTLVDNLLESASLETGMFRISARATDVVLLIEEIADTMRPLLRKYGQRLVLDLPAVLPPVLADPRRTRQVVVNLLSNASKYGPADAEIHLSARVQARPHGPDQIYIAVTDEGAGVPEVDRRRLFHRFIHLSDSGDPSHYGTGLGLWVVKSIVEAQGGAVGVENRAERGARFWFTVPLAS